MARARSVGAGSSRSLNGRWELAAVTAGLAHHPDDFVHIHAEWIGCDEPMPVAAALRAADRWDVDRPRDFDADDWWYRCRFVVDAIDRPLRLRFGGLATVADVWLNGCHILHSDSMFVEHVVDIAAVVRTGDNE